MRVLFKNMHTTRIFMQLSTLHFGSEVKKSHEREVSSITSHYSTGRC